MKLLDRLLTIVAPHECLVCDQEGSLLCNWCTPDACPVLPERCYRCRALSRDGKVCAKCKRRSPLSHVWVRTEYQGAAKKLLYKLKFGRAPAAAEPIGRLLAETLPYLGEGVVITHVPTATSRRRQRGYDQAELMAKVLARETGMVHMTLLARMGQTRQVGASKKVRQSQLATAFRPLHASVIKDAEIIVVDDIVTTGATLESAARILKAHGAKRVYAAVFAAKT